MKRVLKNKRGVAMESAILFMFVVLMLGLALTSVISLSHLQVKVNDTLLKREITIEQIGNDFVHGTLVIGEDGKIEGYDGYYADDESTENKLIVTNKNGTHLLTVTVNTEGKVTKWCYTTE